MVRKRTSRRRRGEDWVFRFGLVSNEKKIAGKTRTERTATAKSKKTNETKNTNSKRTNNGVIISTRGFASKSPEEYLPHAVIPFPSLSPTMTQGGIASWAVQEGAKINAGDILAEIQTDKATMEMECMDDGYLAKILVQAGEADDIPIGRAMR